MTVERMRERMVKAGLLTNDEIDQFLADIQSPDFHAITGIDPLCGVGAKAGLTR